MSQKVKRQNFLSKYEKTLNKQTLNTRERKRRKVPSKKKKRNTSGLSRPVCVCVCESRPRLTKKREHTQATKASDFWLCCCVRRNEEEELLFFEKGFAEESRHHERGDIVVVVESVCQSRPVAKTPSAHADVQTHVPGVLFRRGHVRNLLRLREGEREEEDRALIILKGGE